VAQSIRVQRIAGLAVGTAILAQCVLAQKTGNPNGGGGVASRPNAGSPQPAPGPSVNSPNMGIYLSGRVVMEDGTPPPEPVTIERVCSASSRAQAYTDQKGRFSFQMGQTNGVLQDASEDNSVSPGMPRSLGANPAAMSVPQPNVPDSRLANCELRALLAGFRSDTVDLTGRRLMDDPDVGTIVLRRLGSVAGTFVSMTSLAAPKDARRAYEKALAAVQKQKPAGAERDLQRAVEIYPKYAAAWYELGRIQEQKPDAAAARESYRKALAADPKFITPYIQLAGLAANAGNWLELAEITGRLIQLDPVDYGVAYFYNAIANLNLRRLDEAEKSARAGEKLDTAHRYPKRVELLAVILERKGDYAGAAECLRKYLEWAPEAEDGAQMKVRLAEMERRAGENQQAQNLAPAKERPPASGPPLPQ